MKGKTSWGYIKKDDIFPIKTFTDQTNLSKKKKKESVPNPIPSISLPNLIKWCRGEPETPFD